MLIHLFLYLTAGLKEFKKDIRFKERKYIKIADDGIHLCNNQGSTEEIFSWNEFLTATWNKNVIIIYYRESKDFVIIPTDSIRNDEQQAVVNILRTVFNL